MTKYKCPSCGNPLEGMNYRCSCTGSTKKEKSKEEIEAEELRSFVIQQCIRCGFTISLNLSTSELIEGLAATLEACQSRHGERDRDDIEKSKLRVAERDSLRAQLATITAERDEMLRRIGANETAQLLTQAVEAQCKRSAELEAERDRYKKEADDAHGLFQSEIKRNATLTAAAVVKDAALREIGTRDFCSEHGFVGVGHRCGSFDGMAHEVKLLPTAEAALSPTSSPLIADVKAAAVALEWALAMVPSPCRCVSFSTPPHVCTGHRALARLARWITP